MFRDFNEFKGLGENGVPEWSKERTGRRPSGGNNADPTSGLGNRCSSLEKVGGNKNSSATGNPLALRTKLQQGQ
jgi:hypothetical protein